MGFLQRMKSGSSIPAAPAKLTTTTSSGSAVVGSGGGGGGSHGYTGAADRGTDPAVGSLNRANSAAVPGMHSSAATSPNTSFRKEFNNNNTNMNSSSGSRSLSPLGALMHRSKSSQVTSSTTGASAATAGIKPLG